MHEDKTNHRAVKERLAPGALCPGFVRDEEIGLGDAVKRMTYAMGIRPCTGCEHRAAAPNRWMVFTR